MRIQKCFHELVILVLNNDSFRSILIKDLRFSVELQQTLSEAAKQKRVGEARIITAKAEVESAKLMREASDILNTPAAMQMRYLETLSQMSKASGTKVIFMPSALEGSSVGGGGGGGGEFLNNNSKVNFAQAAIQDELLH